MIDIAGRSSPRDHNADTSLLTQISGDGHNRDLSMAQFRIDTLDDLARQLTFSPHDTRVAQIAAAEDLLHTLDPAKAY
ncbi:MAG: hypothetical protein JWN40_3479, partial [Phycisphaerales bacterium]|nr:hypothetical protein [Phycisphaerales bacterium]